MCIFFFFNDTATTEIYTLSLHDALPISAVRLDDVPDEREAEAAPLHVVDEPRPDAVELLEDLPLLLADRKSTRLNSSHANISYAVFCLKKKKHLTAFFFRLFLHIIIALF